jgi:hypothetical protein
MLRTVFLMGFIVMGMGSVSSKAAVLEGWASGFSVLNCMAANTTGRAQWVDQVQYQWTCNQGPMDPFPMNFEVIPCFGDCRVEPGATFFHNFGPFTGNCPFVRNAFCRAFTRDAPGN